MWYLHNWSNRSIYKDYKQYKPTAFINILSFKTPEITYIGDCVYYYGILKNDKILT